MVYLGILCDRMPLSFTIHTKKKLPLIFRLLHSLKFQMPCIGIVINGIETYAANCKVKHLCGNLWQFDEGSSAPLKYTVAIYTNMPKKTLEKCIFICACIYDLFFFSLSIMSIFTSVFQRVCGLLLLHLLFQRLLKVFISSTSFNGWFLKFPLTQTNRKGKTFHFIWICKI